MYSTCLFCHAPLGANAMLEHFPVGRRIAYDPARGRLWVACPSCRQWSLSPLDERWEAAWREAEEVAAIADSLTLPERVALRLERMRG